MAKRRRRAPPKRPGQPAASSSANKATAGPAAPGAARRILGALAVLFLVGVALGVGVSFVVPAGLFATDRADAGIASDTGASLEDVAALAGDGDDPALFAAGALANTLLLVDHAGGATEKKRADALMKTTLAWVRLDPKALFARTLLARVGVEDNALDDDIDKRADERQKDPWWLLARSARALDRGKRDDAFALVQRAALGDRAPLRAQVELARQSIARGDVADARAVAARITRKAPEHAQGLVIGMLAAVVEDVKDGDSPEERALKLKRIKQRQGAHRDGPRPRPGEAHRDRDADVEASLASWHSDEEQAALDALDRLDARDAGVVAFVLEALAATRGDDALAAQMKERVAPVAPAFVTLAARQVELSLLVGDVAGAEALLSAALEKNSGNVELLLDQARLKALAVMSEDELRRRASEKQRAITVDELDLPFGKLVLDPFGIGGIPMKAEFDAGALPEAAFATALRAGNIAKKLDVVVLIHKGDTALARGDIPAAAAAAAQAKAQAGGDPDVLFLDARIKLRQADRAGAKDAIDAALAASPEDPHVLLSAARLHYDNEGYIPARKTLTKLRQLGLKSPAALALEAMLAARANDDRAAQAALTEAENIGAGDVEILRAKVLVLRDGKDLEAVRKAADRLYAVDRLQATDPILRAWEADAAARQGDTVRAQAVLEDVIGARGNLADAYLLLGSIEAGTDAKAAAARFDKAIDLAPGSAIAGEAARRKAVLKGVKGAGPPPAQGKSKLLPRKRRAAP